MFVCVCMCVGGGSGCPTDHQLMLKPLVKVRWEGPSSRPLQDQSYQLDCNVLCLDPKSAPQHAVAQLGAASLFVHDCIRSIAVLVRASLPCSEVHIFSLYYRERSRD